MDKKSLLAEAWKARENAYAPYSNYKVGAAILSAEGEVFCGCNVENASYGLSCCGERIALYNAVSQGVREFTALALAGEEGIMPCGACLQVLAEFSPELIIYISKGREDEETFNLNQLLPRQFSFKPGEQHNNCLLRGK